MTRLPGQTTSATERLLDTEVLKSFVAIAEHGSFTRAAKAVFRTPSALSMQIKGLETMLDKRLFVREARRVHLTEHGELLLRYARQLLQLNAEAVACFLAPVLDGTVRIGSPDDVGGRILPRVLGAFARSNPAVQVDVMTGTSRLLLQRLDADEIDFTLVTTGKHDFDSKRGEIVHTEPLVWAARRGGSARLREPLPVALAEPAARGAPALSTRSTMRADVTGWRTAAITAPASARRYWQTWRLRHSRAHWSIPRIWRSSMIPSYRRWQKPIPRLCSVPSVPRPARHSHSM
ncbi:Transcriptional regulator LysR family protein [Salinisphaera shabanensis E1L3A]|uniref:Transcriptional regulator LysR family protein n=1 Tax=Salinisphaera shabanensis E1L3A TaxID=1033802 RepID=U2EPN6_9GAMM|nr:LysR family transcriptional regulator [Salinisphaera shabanensis]ERJ19775.1 Transcriptional regulator LysR family protein [Salinisphaera shabanensis E1L3A]